MDGCMELVGSCPLADQWDERSLHLSLTPLLLHPFLPLLRSLPPIRSARPRQKLTPGARMCMCMSVLGGTPSSGLSLPSLTSRTTSLQLTSPTHSTQHNWHATGRAAKQAHMEERLQAAARPGAHQNLARPVGKRANTKAAAHALLEMASAAGTKRSERGGFLLRAA